MPRVLDFHPKIRNVQTLVPKHVISYHMSPPYCSYFCGVHGDFLNPFRKSPDVYGV